MNMAQIVSMADRKYLMIPLSKIRVLNSRTRDRVQFSQNVRSIDAVGLKNPVVVNGRPFEKHGFYELVCGEGRYLAYSALKRDRIQAEVINCDRKMALLISLVENMARVPPKTMTYAREVKRMKDCGLGLARISQIVGRPEVELTDYIRLVEMGEERLINGVEQKLFSISFALAVSKANDGNIQGVLMDAFDSGIIDSTNVNKVRLMIELRFNRGKEPGHSKSGATPAYTVADLKRDIAEATREKEGFVRESKEKENRVLNLIDALDTLWKDERLAALMREDGFGERPALTGKYTTQGGTEQP